MVVFACLIQSHLSLPVAVLAQTTAICMLWMVTSTLLKSYIIFPSQSHEPSLVIINCITYVNACMHVWCTHDQGLIRSNQCDLQQRPERQSVGQSHMCMHSNTHAAHRQGGHASSPLQWACVCFVIDEYVVVRSARHLKFWATFNRLLSRSTCVWHVWRIVCLCEWSKYHVKSILSIGPDVISTWSSGSCVWCVVHTWCTTAFSHSGSNTSAQGLNSVDTCVAVVCTSQCKYCCVGVINDIQDQSVNASAMWAAGDHTASHSRTTHHKVAIDVFVKK